MTIIARLKKLLGPKHRNLVGHIWIGLSILYDLIRAAVVTLVFRKNGLNGVTYFIFSVIFSIIFALTSFQLVLALIDHKSRRSLFFAVASTVSFFAPDAYIFIVGKKITAGTYALLIVYLIITSSFAVYKLIKKYKKPSLS